MEPKTRVVFRVSYKCSANGIGFDVKKTRVVFRYPTNVLQMVWDLMEPKTRVVFRVSYKCSANGIGFDGAENKSCF